MKSDRNSYFNYKIYLAENQGECMEYCALKLQFYLKKITGFLFPIDKNIEKNNDFYSLFLMDKSNKNCYSNVLFNNIIDDGFCLTNCGNGIIITARTQRGVMYGVFDYLERCYGARFLTNDFEVIKKHDHLIFVDNDILSNPDFLMRGYFIGDSYDDLNLCGNVDMEFVLKNRNKDIFMKIPEKYGGDHKVYGRNYVHNFHFYLPFEKYGNSHPEWYRFFYALNKITPTIDITNGITDDGKLDETMDESVAKIVISEMIKDAENHPEKEIFNFTQEDGDYFYQSERADKLAEKYKRSGILVRFCNVVESEVNKYLMEKYKRTIKIVTFAYSYAKYAPVKWVDGKCYPIDESVIVNKNVIIQLALFANGCYSYFSEKQDDEVRKVMTEWKTVANDFWFWMYDINFHKYLYYYDSFDQIEENVRGFKNYGISYLAVNGPLEEGRSWQCNIRAYAYRKLMWNTSLNAKKLMDEYIDLYYGLSAPCVKEVIKKFRNNAINCRKDSSYKLTTRGSCENSKYTSKELLLEILDEIVKGEEIIKNSNLSENEKNLYLEHLYGVKATPLLMLYDMYFEHHKNGNLKDYLKLKEQFFNTCKLAKIHMAGEHWTIDQFRKECDDADILNGRTEENCM